MPILPAPDPLSFPLRLCASLSPSGSEHHEEDVQVVHRGKLGHLGRLHRDRCGAARAGLGRAATGACRGTGDLLLHRPCITERIEPLEFSAADRRTTHWIIHAGNCSGLCPGALGRSTRG